MIEAGRFRGRATKWGPTKSANGTPKIAVEFELLEGPDANKHITFFGGIQGGGFEFTTKVLLAAGWDGEAAPGQGELPNEVTLVIEHREWDGKVKAEIVAVYPLDEDGAGGPSLVEKYAMAPAEAAAFSRDFMARFKQSGIAPKKPAAPAPRPAAQQPARQAAPASSTPPRRPAPAPKAAPPPQDDAGLPPEPQGEGFDF
jgi:hypothetical protein